MSSFKNYQEGEEVSLANCILRRLIMNHVVIYDGLLCNSVSNNRIIG